MRIVFFGSADFAVESLKRLIDEGFDIVGVVTAPDKPAGRGLKLLSTPVKRFAQERGLAILQPIKLKDEKFLDALRNLSPDLQVVVAFRYLPKVVWEIPPLGTINLHASYLPNYRGAAPINWAIINGEKQTGVSTFFINDNIDTGSIIMRKKIPILPDDTAGSLHDRLMREGAELLVETVRKIEKGQVEVIDQRVLEQEFDILKSAPKIFQENSRIDWNKSSDEIYNFIRGMSPYPGAWTVLVDEDKQKKISNVKIFAAIPQKNNHNYPVGKVITDKKSFFKVAVPDGFIIIKEIQFPGKKRLPIEEFLKGFKSDNAHFE